MSAPLFPVKRAAPEPEEEKAPSQSWLTVGQSFAPQSKSKPQYQPESSPSQRKKASDFFELSSEGEAEPEPAEKEKEPQQPVKKRHKHRHKTAPEEKLRRTHRMLVEVLAQQNKDVVPASEVLQSELVQSMVSGKTADEIAASFIDNDVAGKIKEMQLRRQFDQGQNLKPIIIDKDLPPICYDTVRRDDQYSYGSFLIQEIPTYSRIVKYFLSV